MKKIIHKSAIPLYAAAAVWVLYALLFPLHRVMHFALVAAASLVAYFVAAKLCPLVVEEVEEKPQKTGNEELDRMIAESRLAISELKRLDDNIEDETISAQIRRLEEISTRIFDQVRANPGKLPQIRRFMNYYLPTTLKMLNAYDRMGEQKIGGENVQGTMDRVEDIMATIVKAFEKQLDALFGAEAMDISTDITVLENMLAREGLTEDALHRKVREEKTVPEEDEHGDEENSSSDGIRLEL